MSEGIKGLVGKKLYSNYKFMDTNVKVKKLSVSEVMAIQERSKNSEKDEKEGYEILKEVIRYGVEGGNELTDEDFETFALDEVNKLAMHIMKNSGMIGDQGKS